MLPDLCLIQDLYCNLEMQSTNDNFIHQVAGSYFIMRESLAEVADPKF